MATTEIMLAVIGIILFLGFLGQLIFRKTDIPNVLWLLLFGYLLTHIGGIVDVELLNGFREIAGAVAIIIILSDGGMSLRAREIFKAMSHGTILMVSNLLIAVIAVTAIMYLFGFGLLLSLLMATILAGTSAAIVVPVVTKMKSLTNAAKSILSLESLADNFALVGFFILMDIILMGSTRPEDILSVMANGILLAFAVGMIVGAIWFLILARLREIDYSYLATLAVFFFVYLAAEFLGGNGGIAVFVAGLTLGNISSFYNKFNLLGSKMRLGVYTMKYHGLVSFLVRTFFFVYLGTVVRLDDTQSIGIGLAIVAVLLAGRVGAVKLISRRFSELTMFDRRVMYVMFPRGLSPAVLALLPAAAGIQGTGMFADIVFVVIFGTVALTTLGVFYARKREEASVKAAQGAPVPEPKSILYRQKKGKPLESSFERELEKDAAD